MGVAESQKERSLFLPSRPGLRPMFFPTPGTVNDPVPHDPTCSSFQSWQLAGGDKYNAWNFNPPRACSDLPTIIFFGCSSYYTYDPDTGSYSICGVSASSADTNCAGSPVFSCTPPPTSPPSPLPPLQHPQPPPPSSPAGPPVLPPGAPPFSPPVAPPSSPPAPSESGTIA